MNVSVRLGHLEEVSAGEVPHPCHFADRGVKIFPRPLILRAIISLGRNLRQNSAALNIGTVSKGGAAAFAKKKYVTSYPDSSAQAIQ
jgi:hypothetical protein